MKFRYEFLTRSYSNVIKLVKELQKIGVNIEFPDEYSLTNMPYHIKFEFDKKIDCKKLVNSGTIETYYIFEKQEKLVKKEENVLIETNWEVKSEYE